MFNQNKINELIATIIWLGYSPVAPGTLGSIIALPAAYLISYYVGYWFFIFTIFIFFVVGTYTTGQILKVTANQDPSEVIIDEVVGQWISLTPIILVTIVDTDKNSFFSKALLWITAFVLFRFLDIIKPWPISWADKKIGAFWVMIDDVLAGVATALLLLIIMRISGY